MINGVRILALLGLLALLAACSQTHSEIRAGYRWSELSRIAVAEPPADRWGLTPVLRQELAAAGYRLVTADSGSPQVVARFTTEEGLDFTSEVELVTRPKVIHLQLADAASGKVVLLVDYFLRSAENPAAAMRAAVADLQEQIRTAAAAPGKPRVASPAAPKVTPSAAPVAVPAPSAPIAAPLSPVAEQPVPAPGAVATPVVEPLAAPTPAEAPPFTPAPAETAVEAGPAEEEAPLVPRSQSPWTPRFKSWGTEEWGKPGKTE